MATKSTPAEETVTLTDDGREATIVEAPATTFDERTVTKSQVELTAEPEK